MTNSIPEIEDADCIFLIGSNITEAHPLIAHRVFRGKLKGAKLIVIDPRKIQLTLQADIHLRINFGADVAFINGLMKAIIDNDWHNRDFIDERTEGLERIRDSGNHRDNGQKLRFLSERSLKPQSFTFIDGIGRESELTQLPLKTVDLQNRISHVTPAFIFKMTTKPQFVQRVLK